MSALPPPPPAPPGAPPSPLATPPEPPAAPAVETPSRGPIVVGVVILVALVVAGFAVERFAVANSEPCEESDFRSALFEYCLTTPEGWIPGQGGTADAAVDQFAPPDQQAAIYIEAAEVGERTLEGFADDVRGLGTQSGYDLTDPVERVVAGVRARQWDAVSGTGVAATKIREVVFIQDGTAWRVQLASTTRHFDENVGALGDLLESWQFA